jgi:uncharacterized protein (TIGR02147 family)
MADSRKANPAFSQRAFARKLGVAPGFLNEVLAGKKNLSNQTAFKLAARLELSREETEVFCALVQLELTRDLDARRKIIERLRGLNLDGQVPADLSVEVFAAIADWYHVAIRNLVELDGARLTPAEAARRLGITELEAELALDRLLKLELIERNEAKPSGYSRTEPHSWIESQAPNGALRRFHRQMLAKAMESLETQSNAEKVVATHTLAVPDAAFAEADRLIDEFLLKMAKLAELPGPRTQVYHLGLQYFNLTPLSGRKAAHEKRIRR